MKKNKHNRSRRIGTRFAASLAAVALVAGACGSDDESAPADDPVAVDSGSDDAPDSTEASDDGGSELGLGECETAPNEGGTVESLSELDFSGLTVNVATKDFVEQFVLGQLLIVALEETGATTIDNVNLGGSAVVRGAQLSGEVDASWEYNGTGWNVHLGNEEVPDDSDVLTTQTCEQDLAENDIRWIGQSPFNNTYGFATGPDFLDDGEPFTLQSMADHISENPDATVCLETEFPNRPDGLVLFEEATGVIIPQEQISILEVGVVYDQTASGECDFGEIFTTDGRILSLGLNLVEDPGVFIIYNVSLTMGDELYQQNPEGWLQLTNTLLEGLDDETMAELNRQVSEDGLDPAQVARDYLTDQGLI